jgi:hypothetical protein
LLLVLGWVVLALLVAMVFGLMVVTGRKERR